MTTRSKPLTLDVGGNNNGAIAYSGSNREDVTFIAEDIRFIKTDKIKIPASNNRLLIWVFAPYLASITLFLFPVALGRFTQIRNESEDERKSKSALRVALKDLNSNENESLSHISSVMYKYFKSKLFLQTENLDPLILENSLKGKVILENSKSCFVRAEERLIVGIDIEDLIQIGMYGLVTAAQNYVVKEGVSFASYAGIRIRGEIVDHLRRNSNLCRTTIQMQQKYNVSFEKLSRQLQREPKNSEIAKDMGLEASELDNWEQAFAANTHQSLDTVYDEFSIWFATKEQNPEEELTDTELRENLINALKTLPEREALLIQLYYVNCRYNGFVRNFLI